MSCSGGSSRRVAGAVSAVGAVRHEAKKGMATRVRRSTIAETVFIFSSSQKKHLKAPNQDKNETHAYLVGIAKFVWGYLPTTRTTNVFSLAAAPPGPGPLCPVTRRMLWVFESRAMVLAPNRVAKLSTTVNLSAESYC